MQLQQPIHAVGKRKTAVARIWMRAGDGRILVNDRPLDEYFGRETAKMIIRQPLTLTGTDGQYNITVNVRGGGISGQAGAVRHGISRALLKVNTEFRKVLKRAGFLTRDAREKERKKYGQRGARARFQYSKR
ncbi:MAG: 30S ribosomal protein S9 [Deltaproteobacteria bacterium]|nr:30S ribosomal protein S9 [Deltaproteobacteria bacterium]MBI3077274.1 30S ribosomal protein S9 [Deltaproteobacteria bacterium]